MTTLRGGLPRPGYERDGLDHPKDLDAGQPRRQRAAIRWEVLQTLLERQRPATERELAAATGRPRESVREAIAAPADGGMVKVAQQHPDLSQTTPDARLQQSVCCVTWRQFKGCPNEDRPDSFYP